MKVRCCVIGISWLVALGVICHGHDHEVDASPRSSSKASETTFLVKPYLQLGDIPPGRVAADLVLLWHANDGEAVWAGAGGNTLYNPEQQDNPGSWQSFSHKFSSKIHSLTVADINGTTLTVRQVSMNSADLDRFTITK